MEFIFDQSRSSINPAIDDFKNNSPIRRSVTRKPISTIEEIEIAGQRPKRRRKTVSKPPVKYVSKTRKARSQSFSVKMTWTKFGWMICGCLILRMIFMESGIIDYYKMEDTIQNKIHSLKLVKKENRELSGEIRKIKTSPRYQKKMAREHLGVISSNEYLVIFGQDS